ncbi:N-acetylglucosamine-6-phosphate deacetylase [Halomicronema sp. CCY15110]|uniref:N-acetylglucosamine-6-phosphate deacetylase n=1 Tax=Halomicronema sp. CCY15110 TaxID=2767773 RepID=UPI00194DFC04|nr:N-acetylglucosamine-6-phosphate deacetylase [Halomicronema sp. CCY15110]
MLALTNCRIYTGLEGLEGFALLIECDRIQGLTTAADLPADCERVDLGGASIAPGFIDLQLNGCGGVMFNDAIAAATLDIMHQTNLRSGTTSFLPTLITTSDADMQAAMTVVQAYRQNHPHSVLGLHLEGPYLNPKRKGIHNGRYVRSPDAEMIAAIAEAGPETVRLVTLAPEMATAADMAPLTQAGIVVSAGHTNANYGQAVEGFSQGVTMATHLFNAMSPWQSRQPGMVGAVLDQSDIYAGIIADGHHVHFTSLALAHKLKGDRLLLVTDATPPAGTDMDSFIIGGQRVYYRDGKCVSAEGTLGGSALTMIAAIANCVHHVGIPLPEALRMASGYPAQAIHVADQYGQLAPGYVANVSIFDSALRLLGVVDRGHLQLFDPTAAASAHAQARALP